MASWPYNTKAWKRLRRAKLMRNPFCEHCHEAGKLVPAKIADHIIAINNGGPAFPSIDGLQSLCQACHNRKTVGDNRQRRKYDLDGNPADLDNPWHGGTSDHEDICAGDRRLGTTSHIYLNSHSFEMDR